MSEQTRQPTAEAESSTNHRESLTIAPEQDQLVEVESLKKYFTVGSGLFGRKSEQVRAVDDVSFSIPRGKTLGLVGESGSGKTTLARTLLRLIEPTAGTVRIDGEDVTAMPDQRLRQFRRNMQIVFQDPTSSLNPRKQVKDIITSPMKVHDIGSKDERLARVEEMLEVVDLPREFMDKYPNELSGGQKQRVGIARALVLQPELLVLDEPTSALDVSVQARIIHLLDDLQDEFDLTYLIITHDLSVVKNISDWLAVMYLGKIVEIGDVEEVFRTPRHPYTRALLSSIKTVTAEDRKLIPERIELEGEIPDPRNKPSGCGFRTRCPEEFEACGQVEPPLYETGEDHYARCLLHDEYRNEGRGSVYVDPNYYENQDARR
jgi:oligopeptide transport system ATP-binding protein